MRRWQAQIYAETLTKLEAKIAPLLAEASNNFEAIKETLFIPEQVFHGPKKIFFAINSCEWSNDPCMPGVSFQDYALMHIKALLPFLDPASQISIGFIDHNTTYLGKTLLTPKDLSEALADYTELADLINGWPHLESGHTGDRETIARLYQTSRTKFGNFNYVLFFTDGYGQPSVDQRAVRQDPNAVFLFKPLSKAGMLRYGDYFVPYVRKVARAGHDVVLNANFEAPRYVEYFDRKAAIDVYQLLMQQVQDMKKEAQIP